MFTSLCIAVLLLANWSCVSLPVKQILATASIPSMPMSLIGLFSSHNFNLRRYLHGRVQFGSSFSRQMQIYATQRYQDKDGYNGPLKVTDLVDKDILNSTPVVHQHGIDLALNRRRLQLFWAIQFATMYQFSKPSFGDSSLASSIGISTGLQPTDEIEVVVPAASSSIGLGLKEVAYKDFFRIVVSSVKESAEPAVKLAVKAGMILVAVNNEIVEGRTLKDVYAVIKSAKASQQAAIKLTLRDPQLFFAQLYSPLPDTFSSPMAPDGRAKLLSVKRLSRTNQTANSTSPEPRKAMKGDVVEVIYEAVAIKLPDAEQPLPSDAVVIKDGFSEHYNDGDVAERYSIFFVLGSQKKQGKFTHFGAPEGGGAGDGSTAPGIRSSSGGGSGQMSAVAVASNGMGTVGGIFADSAGVLPSSWDILLGGMSVGEERTLSLPDCFFAPESLRKIVQRDLSSYDRLGLQLKVRLLSINGDTSY